ncbi:hypothetical protein BP6252_00331 [Coleophoma cylindrospora]|uniref:Zn(2)-C6 fungal-type domain-containing protein n=1 Tax=Coleophoma cylindrospora TaxID=1849047 RepID=A0A3D8SPP9_9HELO|nr:hypothetical protein BP6252_00331 [Coleophoma cylindrospora]
MALAEKACTTCRRKCRKCDRSQPACRRCATKGLLCEGYPDKFKFVGIATRGKWKGLEKPLPSDAQTLPIRKSAHQSHHLPRNVTPQSMSPLQLNTLPTLSTHVDVTKVSSIICLEEEVSQQDDVELPNIPDVNIPDSTIEDLLNVENTGRTLLLLSYYDQYVCPAITVSRSGERNPFREDVLPLAYHHVGLLHAILGLAACHMNTSGQQHILPSQTEALKHHLEANRFLKLLLAEEAKDLLQQSDVDVILAILVILSFQDVCGGTPSNDFHLTAAAYMCRRIHIDGRYNSTQGSMTAYLLGTLAWLDLMRGLSDPATLIFTQDDRRRIVAEAGPDFELITGCNKSLFILVGDIVSQEQSYLRGSVSRSIFERFLQRKEAELRAWREEPTSHPNLNAGLPWKHLSETIRHACILRLLRLPDLSLRSPHAPEIQASVQQILNSASEIPSANPLAKRLLFSLSLAAADALTPHERHYCTLRIGEVQTQTGFSAQALLALGQVYSI